MGHYFFIICIRNTYSGALTASDYMSRPRPSRLSEKSPGASRPFSFGGSTVDRRWRDMDVALRIARRDFQPEFSANRLDIFMLLKLITFVTVNKRRYINI